MGRLRRKHNWKARLQNESIAEEKPETDVIIERKDKDSNYDASNPLVLPSKKSKKEKQREYQASKVVKPLTKAQRKKLQRVVESKKRKTNRAKLLESLQQHQATTEQLKLMKSVSAMQTTGLKRSRSNDVDKLNSIKKNRKIPKTDSEKVSYPSDVVGFDSSSSEDSQEESDDDNDNQSASENIQSSPKQQTNGQQTNEQSSEITVEPKKVSKEEEKCEKKDEQKVDSKPALFVQLQRKPQIQELRMKLPIAGEEQAIMEAINENPVVILCGETGSGKTTQVPQFLYEAGYATGPGIIGVTEPRRVAAIAMSQRVAQEMNLSSDQVSYQIRFEGNVTEQTKIKFMTDGVLLKEVQNDFLLNRYSVIIIDEAHERSIYTDILIGLLSRIVPLRHKRNNPLKLVIMSATLRIEDFTENNNLFKTTPPVIKVEARQFPVTIHFNKQTSEDYMTDAFKKICKIHRQLPEGGILVFVTGQQEVNVLCKKLNNTFKRVSSSVIQDNQEEVEETKIDESEAVVLKKVRKKMKIKEINLDDYAVQPLADDTELECDDQHEHFVDEDDDLENDEELIVDKSSCQAVHVLPLYSLLSSKNQSKVFDKPPDNSRLIVVSTNVAETSLTIPNIRYVVDTGKVKARCYDKVTGVSAFSIQWTSKASANQRAGRAGRMGPGHCYRLFSSAVFNDEFLQYSMPEICQKPVDDLVLQMKSMNIDKVINFPFPSRPDTTSLKSSELRLIQLGALAKPVTLKTLRAKDKDKFEGLAKITELGKVMSCFPIGARYAKMLALSHQHDLLAYTIAIISALTVQQLFIASHDLGKDNDEEQVQKILGIRRKWAGSDNCLKLGDVAMLLKAVGTAEFSNFNYGWCQRHGVRYKAMLEIRKLRVQLSNSVNLILPNIGLAVDPQMMPPSDEQSKLLRQIMLAGLADHVARKIPTDEVSEEDKKRLKNAYHCAEMEEPVFIHPESVLFNKLPDFVVYQEIIETKKMYMKGITAIESDWLIKFAPDLCSITPNDLPPKYDSDLDQIVVSVDATFGRRSWNLPKAHVEMSTDLNKYKWFARFLLEGKILDKFCELKPLLIASPATILRHVNNVHPRIENLLKLLVREQVTTKAKLLSAWKNNKNYLQDAIKQWLPQSSHNRLVELWPPI